MAKKKKQKKKNTPPKQPTVSRPKEFLDLIAPAAVKFNTDHFILGGTYRSVVALRSYPPTTEELALLRRLGEMAGVTLRLSARRVTTAEEDAIIHAANIFHTPDRYACQVHLDERLFHATFPTAIPLNDSGLKGNPLKLGRLEGDIPRSGGEIAVVVPAAVALALLIALVPGRLGQFLRLGLQQFVEGFFYAASYQLLELALDCFLI